MANLLKVSIQHSIYTLADQGWSQRRIARELAIHRETVGRYLRERSKPAISITGAESGSPDDPAAKPAISIAGSKGEAEPKPAIVITGSAAGRTSLCKALAEVIEAKLQLGLSAKRIHQDLVVEHGFGDSCQSVQRFVRRLKESEPERVWRIECQPGEEAQVDFGLGAPIYDETHPKGRRTWVFRLVLSYSRKGYSEAVTHQDTETFLRCLENAFRRFGGVPLTLNVDHLKAAVLRADWFDPEINPKLAEFCRHYGTHVVPCRPFTPEHKGNGVAAWKIYGPDLSGTYGGLHGLGGLEAVIGGDNVTRGVVSDWFGNAVGTVAAPGSEIVWSKSQFTAFGPVPGWNTPPVDGTKPLHELLGYRGLTLDPTGYVQQGLRAYDPQVGRWLFDSRRGCRWGDL